MLEQIKKLVSLGAVSGNEKTVSEYIKTEITPYVDKVYTDVMGNLVALKKGSGKRIMLMAHTDEIGLVSTFIDPDGFVRVAAVGGVSPANFICSQVTFENGVRGVLASEKTKDVKMNECYVDIGAKDFDEAISMIDIGMTARFDADTFETKNTIVSKALDNRIGCYILMQVIKTLKNTDAEVYFVFTSQEEVGLRGARVAGFDINPDIAIAVDVTTSCDTPENKNYGCKLGSGAAIKVRDASAICSMQVVEDLEAVAKENEIPYQRDVLVRGGTDIGAVQTGGRGALVGGVSVATRYVHSCCETVSKKDVESAISLIKAYLEKCVENA